MTTGATLSIGFVELYVCFALFGAGLIVIYRLRAYAKVVTIILVMLAAVLATDLFTITAVRSLPHLEREGDSPTIYY